MNTKSFTLSSLNGSIGRLAWERSIMETVDRADAAIHAANVEIERLQGEIAKLEAVKDRGNRAFIKSLSVNV